MQCDIIYTLCDITIHFISGPKCDIIVRFTLEPPKNCVCAPSAGCKYVIQAPIMHLFRRLQTITRQRVSLS